MNPSHAITRFPLVPFLVLAGLAAALCAAPATAQTPLFEIENEAGQALFRIDEHGGVLAPLPADDVQIVIPIEGPGTRFMWHPTQAALRSGLVDGGQWDGVNVGLGSVAMGRNTIASGPYAFAMGEGSVAAGDGASAFGQSAATGPYSFAAGSGSVASESHSFALGDRSTASGYAAFAMGRVANATGDHALAAGLGAEASGEAATALGFGTAAEGNHSTALGSLTTAQAFASVALGRYNVISGDPQSVVDTDPLLVAGNGTSDSDRSNALTLLRTGDLTIAGTLTESSDIRLKVEVEPVRGALAEVLHLTPIRYRYRPGTGHPTGPQLGLSAQEVREVLPELVREDPDGFLSVAYTDLGAVLIGAVKEQQAEIERLREEVSTLRAELAAMRADLETIRADGVAPAAAHEAVRTP